MTTEDSAKAQEQNTNEEAKAIEQVSDDVKMLLRKQLIVQRQRKHL